MILQFIRKKMMLSYHISRDGFFPFLRGAQFAQPFSVDKMKSMQQICFSLTESFIFCSCYADGKIARNVVKSIYLNDCKQAFKHIYQQSV